MKNLILLSLLVCIKSLVNGQFSNASNYVAIDHVPIVVKNLDSVKKVLSNDLGFKVKDGKAHLSIRNCFIKFHDGTYLEFIEPVDTMQAIGSFYTRFLAQRQGGSLLAISVHSADTIVAFLKQKHISFEVDSNKTWRTVEPIGMDMFFINYSNKIWRDSEENATHINNANALKATFIIDDNLKILKNRYNTFGFKEALKGTFIGAPYESLSIGHNELRLLKFSKSKNIISKFGSRKFLGICGFEIEVSTLKDLKRIIAKAKNVIIKKTEIVYFFTDSNFFFVFTEKQKGLGQLNFK